MGDEFWLCKIKVLKLLSTECSGLLLAHLMYWGCVVRWSELCEAMFNKSLLLTCRYFNIHLQWPFSYYWRTHSFLFLSNTYIHACRHTTFMQCIHSSTLPRLLSHMVFSRICFLLLVLFVLYTTDLQGFSNCLRFHLSSLLTISKPSSTVYSWGGSVE